MKISTSGSVKFVRMSLDRPTRSIRLLQTDRMSQNRLRANVGPYTLPNKQINQKFVL